MQLLLFGRVSCLRGLCVVASPRSWRSLSVPVRRVSNAYTKPSGNWKVERQTDRITGAPISSAYLNTRTSSNSAVAFPQPATTQLSCFKEQPIVRFAFLFKIGSSRNSELGYRFDEKPGHEPRARFVDGYTSVEIEEPAEESRNS